MVSSMLQKWFRDVHYSQLIDDFVKFNYILIFLCAGYLLLTVGVEVSKYNVDSSIPPQSFSTFPSHILIIYFRGMHIKNCSMFLRTYSLNLYNVSISANFPCAEVYSKLNGSPTLITLVCECW